jgi:hypothetical protein
VSWLTWVKTAANVSTGGLSSLYLYGGLLVAGAAAATGANLWHGWKVDGAHDDAFKAGQAQVRGDTLAAENRALLNQREQIITLSNDLTELRDAHTKATKDLATALAAADRRGQRVRNATPAGGELDQRIGAAECPVVRTFAAKAFRTAAACRDVVADLGFGAGGLVESAASAHYEAGRADALMRFSMPRSPFNTPEKPQ